MNHFAKNIKVVENRDRDLAYRLRATPDDPRIRLIKSGGKTTGIEMICPSGSPAVFQPEKTAGNVRRITEKKLFSFSEVIILLGAGLGDSLRETLAASDGGAFILLVESNTAYFKKLLEGFDVAEMLGDPRVALSVGENPVDAIMARLEDAFGVFTRPNFQVIKNGLAVACDTEYYQQVDRVIARQKLMAESNLLTISRLSSTWQNNIFKNMGALIDSPGITHLFGQLAGIPAIIVAAGPSLDKNCRWIKTAERSMVIIAVDTALKTLQKHGVRPHFVVALDALLYNYFHLSGAESPDYTLVVNPVTYPLILKECKGPMSVTSYSEPMVRWLEQFTGDLGENLTGGSVATAAFDLAWRMGCGPIILAGQDLAFSGGRTHAGGGANQEMVYSSTGDPTDISAMHDDAISLEVRSDVEGNLGHHLKASAKMATWRGWFEIRIGKKNIECINATEGGGVIKGAKIMCLQEAILAHGRKERNIASIIKKATPVRMPADKEKIRRRLETLGGKTREIKKAASAGMKESEKLALAAQVKSSDEWNHGLATCNAYLAVIMREKEFIDINQWRLEATLDKIQRLRVGIKTPDERQRLYLNAESFLMFFRDIYNVAREFEKNIRSLRLMRDGDGEGKAHAV